jgi:hypothetical protein
LAAAAIHATGDAILRARAAARSSARTTAAAIPAPISDTVSDAVSVESLRPAISSQPPTAANSTTGRRAPRVSSRSCERSFIGRMAVSF